MSDLVDKGEIDLVRYGQLWEKVGTLDRKMDSVENDLKEILAEVNKAKGALWLGMALASAIGAIISFAIPAIF